jgi:transcriptional regulator with GAF, ATPase, and Fis domain/tetratricopeptide (TPR) repeat protein
MIHLTTPHWQTLSILSVIDEPVGMDVLVALSPLNEQQLKDLFGKAEGLAVETNERKYLLNPDLPVPFRKRIGRIATGNFIISLVARILRLNLQDRFSISAQISLFLKAGLDFDAANLAEGSARSLVNAGEKRGAMALLKKALDIIILHQGDIEWDTMLIAVVNELCRLKMVLADDLQEIPFLINLEKPVAVRLGDLRTLARIDLVSGLLRYVTGDSSGGLELISAGLRQADELGDEDIMAITAEFRGTYYYLRGMYKEAVDAFDAVVRINSLQSGKTVPTFLPEHLASSSALGYISALLGQYHRATGVLDSHWRRARMNNDRNACFYEALLGIVLIIMGRKAEAFAHLKAAQKEALDIGNPQALHVAKKGLAYHAFLEGKIEEAFWITMNTPHTDSIGPQYNWPVHLEMLYNFEKKDLLPAIPSLAFKREMERVLEGPNHHLRGVALRIRALQAQEREKDSDAVLHLLKESESELLMTGDPVELAKTRAEMARVKLARKDRPAARNFALMAWEGLSGYGQEFFPDDLVPLLRIGVPHRQGPKKQDLLDRFMDLMDGFVPSADVGDLLTRMVATTGRFFGAERGALFWFQTGREALRPGLRASYNLDRMDAYSDDFREPLKLIFKAYRNAEPLILKGIPSGYAEGEGKTTLTVTCLPIVIRGETKGVLYLDNSYIEEEHDDMDRDTILRVSRRISSSIDRILQYAQMIEADRIRSSQNTGEGDETQYKITGSSPVMEALLALADQAAASDATVLITGETGVGKELLARRIHDTSRRKDAPFIVVNLASTPETLVESELFGHEKGAFTGAERQKPGRIEMAHTGTLFIDEIGDVPPSAQVKLLRVIQEKRFERVGGIRTINSDFRLVAATNRDLASDVASGKFRQDLYFRLNVVPLVMPPLRERREDVIELGREFLKQYSKKYHRVLPDLTEENGRALMAYPWPGNVRELKNVMERTAILSTPERLELNLPVADKQTFQRSFSDTPSLDEMQRRYIRHVLSLTGGRIGGPGGAAEILGMKRTTLQARIRKLGV